ncbi:MAG: MobA/MobL family protein [Oscillospiraceae bacterium]|jgi:ATP-dependent exoDNAse (exonuclease V) alpha subunit|nr:MobA/MobL family protein [Oscillospiraceae bacterium]
MANYHMSIKIFSRGKGASAVHKTAYRAAEKLTSEYDGETYDYTRKKGIVYKEILLPENAPQEYKDRSVLWNSVEKSERYITAQLAREFEISLPVELTREQNITLTKQFVKDIFVDAGMCADICIHDNNDGNPHAHITITMRPINEDGSWGVKSITVNGKKVPTVDWNNKDKSEYWRKAWAEYQNVALEEYNIKSRVDHRSYKRQGVNKVPTVHIGASAWLEKKGIRTELGDVNREIAVTNQELRQIRARIKKLKTWLYSQPISDMPTMSDILSGIKGGQELKSRAKKIADLKTLAKVVGFLQENNISDVDDLVDKVTALHEEQYSLVDTIKKQDRRLATLDRHLQQVAVYQQYKPFYKEFTRLEPKKRNAYNNKYAQQLKQHESAHKYLTDHLNGRTTIPEKAWKAEREQLISERYTLTEQYYELKDSVRSIEILKHSAVQLLGNSQTKLQVERTKSFER